MKLIATTITRNSAWIIGATARVALMYCDEIVVLNHASTDRTQSILMEIEEEYSGRVMIIKESNPLWNEMDHRDMVLQAARSRGATHFANVDDDEILTANVHCNVREMSKTILPGGCLIVPFINIWEGLGNYRCDDTEWSGGFGHIVFADKYGTTFKPQADGYQFHNRRPFGNDGAIMEYPLREDWEHGGVMHLQFASYRRLQAKQALYKMIEVVRWPEKRTVAEINAMYDNTALNLPKKMKHVPDEWWHGMEELKTYIDIDAEPWQEKEAQRMYMEHGADKFAGLDLYGVV